MDPESEARVLLVDDDPCLRALMHLELEERGYRVQSFACAETTLAATLDPPSLAVLDFRLPGMDGLDLLGQLRKRYPTLPAIIVTSEPEAVHPFRRGNDPPTHLLGKPFRSLEFLRTVAECARHHRPGT